MTTKDFALIGGCIASLVSGIVAYICIKDSDHAMKSADKAINLANESIEKTKIADEIIKTYTKKIDGAVSDIEKRTEIEIADDLIKEVVEKKAKEMLDRVIPGEVYTMSNAIRNDVYKRIKLDIDDAVEKKKPDIYKKLESDLKAVNIDDIQRQVIKDATNSAKEDALNDIQDEKKRAFDEIEDMIRDLKRHSDRMTKEIESAKDSAISDLKSYKKRMENDIDDKVEDIMDDLEDKAEDRFDEELDDITTKYKSRLDDIGNVYSSLSRKFMN